MTKDDILNLERFLRTQGIVTAPRQLPSADSATISPDESILGALAIVEHLLENKHLYQMPFWRYRPSDRTTIYLGRTWYKCLRTLSSIVSQPWWERVWIVQEAMLSPDAVLNIGQHQFLLSPFLSACRNYATHSETCCILWTGIWHGKSDEISLPFLDKMRTVNSLAKVIDAYGANKLVPISLALLSQERKATDPRDHFYALTALMRNPFTGLALGPSPDYRLTPEELFRTQTLNLMRQSDSIDLLDRAIGIDNPNPLGLPSWVCDWSQYRRLGWRSTIYNACGGHDHQFRNLPNDKTLIIAGTMIGTVSKLGDLVDPTNADDIAIKVEQWQHLAGTHHEAFDTHTVLRATFLDMIMSAEGEHRRLNSRDVAVLDEWWHQWIVRMRRCPAPHQDPDLFTAHSCFGYQMKRDRVFSATAGHEDGHGQRRRRQNFLGVAPRTLRPGDRIFIVQGVKVPLMLRRALLVEEEETPSSPPSNLGRDYAFVGRCYLHGCMDGEALTTSSGTKWQTLHLH